MRRVLLVAAACVAVFGLTVDLRSQTGTGKTGEWRDYAGDKGFTKYSPVDQINASNVKNLQIAWRRSAVADELRDGFAGIFDELLVKERSRAGVGRRRQILRHAIARQRGRRRIMTGDVKA